MPIRPIEWLGTRMRVLDQTRLPSEVAYLECANHLDVAAAIKGMQIRGAPALGVAAAYGLALGAQAIDATSKDDFLAKLGGASRILAATRPTAVNLFWALERMTRMAQVGSDVASVKADLLNEATKIDAENEAADREIGRLGAELLRDGYTVLTHCNAGALATAGYGTALGVIKAAHEQGKKIHVFADETRPLLQGARLTAWELVQEGIQVTLITDNMAGHFMSKGAIDCVVVGADRIAANGDVANKIGTYGVAVLARENAVPFYVAAPISTIDFSLQSGAGIPIEQRSPEEVTHVRGVRMAPDGVGVANPAFDVTPHRYVSAIVTEKGLIREPYQESLKQLVQQG